MAVKKGKSLDKKSWIIIALLFIIGVETYFLYQASPQFREVFVHAKKPATAVKKPVTTPEKLPVVPVPKEVIPVVSRTVPAGTAVMAIVIDDWGYSTKNCQYLKDIKSPITASVLPDLPHSADVMQCAHDAGKEVMLHLPMEPHDNSDTYPEDYLLKTTMSPIKIDSLLSKILDKMPLVDGVNNHMGSKATEDKRLMTTVFKQLKYRGLFFVDSRVTNKSVCAPLAKQMEIPFTARDVFLDNVNERAAIENQLAGAVRIAKKRGKALAIGHDRSLTLQVIENKIPWLKSQGVELVPVKEYIKIQ
jgi:polysaccharide deacetylase 2 family uncharacterized protein YibQ